MLQAVGGDFAGGFALCDRGKAGRGLATRCGKSCSRKLVTAISKALQQAGKYREAEEAGQGVVDHYGANLWLESPEYRRRSLNKLALVIPQAQGKYGQAEPLYQRSLAIHERVLGPDHPRYRKIPEQSGVDCIKAKANTGRPSHYTSAA